MTPRVLVDTGPIVAILAESDTHHDRCVEQLKDLRSPLLTCWPVVTEAAWLLRSYPVAISRLLSSLKGEPFQLLGLGENDLAGIATILARYKSIGLQLADASLVHLANRERIDTIFTLDYCDFGIIRLAGGRKAHLVP